MSCYYLPWSIYKQSDSHIQLQSRKSWLWTRLSTCHLMYKLLNNLMSQTRTLDQNVGQNSDLPLVYHFHLQAWRVVLRRFLGLEGKPQKLRRKTLEGKLRMWDRVHELSLTLLVVSNSYWFSEVGHSNARLLLSFALPRTLYGMWVWNCHKHLSNRFWGGIIQ